MYESSINKCNQLLVRKCKSPYLKINNHIKNYVRIIVLTNYQDVMM